MTAKDDNLQLLTRLRAADPAAGLEPQPAQWIDRLAADITAHPTASGELLSGEQARPANVRTLPAPAKAKAKAKAKVKAQAPATALAPDGAQAKAPVKAPVKAPATPADPVGATAPQRSRWLPWLTAAATVAVITGTGFALMRGDTESPPSAAGQSQTGSTTTSTTIEAPGAVAGKCMVPSPETLGTAELAVDATVTEVAGDQVSLAVQRWYAGTPTDSLVVTSPPEALQSLIGAPDLQKGQRYLLAANGGQLMVCGFSGPADTDRSSLYTAAFGG